VKYIFTGAFIVLTIAGLADHWWFRDDGSATAPTLYWVTDGNPARREQVRLFRKWLADHGYPDINLQLDVSSSDPSKKLIQGVSGVAGDILDLGPADRNLGPCDLPLFASVGMLADVTADAQKLGFGIEHTYPTLESQLCQDGRQYRFPCNVDVTMLWVNLETFERYGMPPPARRWDWESFERQGLAFVAAANPPGKPRSVYFVDTIPLNTMRRSLGLDVFNETLTRCTLDDPRAAQALETLRRWMHDEHLLPSLAEAASFATDSGVGGTGLQLFYRGHLAMFALGRYGLVQMRKLGDLKLDVVEPPFAEFPNAPIDTRAAAVYVASRHKDLAVRFLAFLASDSYNSQIVADADALPPDPSFCQSQAFLRPPDHPNEWRCHQAFADAALSIGVPDSASPFALPSVVFRIEKAAQEACMNSGRLSPSQACARAAALVNDEIARSLIEDPALKAEYDRRVAIQHQIDAARRAGQPIPAEWISNPFYSRYYQSQGWIKR
jgi:multiple sugar transport system substrate-binding protein